ncbi:MAG: hypothetical protein AABX37_00500 [Nanoarchaeota archaeon]
MIIDLSKPRKEYFEEPTIAEILRKYVETKGPITIHHLKDLEREGKIVVGTTQGNLDTILQRESTVHSLDLVDKIDSLDESQLLVLPPEYRIPAGEVRRVVSYSSDTLVKLDTMEVKRALLGDVVPTGPLSGRKKQQKEWHPEKVLATAFNLLHEQRQDLAEQVFTCYSWWGKDHHRRIVSLYRAIQGAELRAFQDYVAFRLLIPKMRKELRVGQNLRTKEPLTLEEQKDREEKIQRYETYLQRHDLKNDLRRMDVDFTDLIELQGDFAYNTGQTVRVPSRAQHERKTYTVKLTDVPLLPEDHRAAYSLVWELAANCPCDDKSYRSDRRKQSPDRGQREDFFCAHGIAAAHTLRKKYERDADTIRFLPFVLPTAEMMHYVDVLREQTIMITFNEETGKPSKRALNHTEMENLLMKRVLAHGYESCFTTDINRFRAERYDPHLDLIQFRS